MSGGSAFKGETLGDASEPDWTSRPARHDVAVALCVDRALYPIAEVVGRRIAALEPDVDVVLCLEGPDLPPDHVLDGPLRYCRLTPDSRIDQLPTTRFFSRAAYARLLLAFQLGREYRRILYVDTDVWTEDRLEPLLTADMKGAAIAAAPDLPAFQAPIQDLRRCYRNSGVLLFDCASGAAEACQAVLDFAQANPDKLPKHDQSALNIVLEGQMALLAPRWNFLHKAVFFPSEDIVRPVILHFVGVDKPWLVRDNPSRLPYRRHYVDGMDALFSADALQAFGLWGTDADDRRKYTNPVREALSRWNSRRNLARRQRRGTRTPPVPPIARDVVQRFVDAADIP